MLQHIRPSMPCHVYVYLYVYTCTSVRFKCSKVSLAFCTNSIGAIARKSRGRRHDEAEDTESPLQHVRASHIVLWHRFMPLPPATRNSLYSHHVLINARPFGLDYGLGWTVLPVWCAEGRMHGWVGRTAWSMLGSPRGSPVKLPAG